MSKAKRNRGNEINLLTCQQVLFGSNRDLRNKDVDATKCRNRLVLGLILSLYATKYYFGAATKRHLRADGLSLLPSALRPRLVGMQRNSNSTNDKILSARYSNLRKNIDSLKNSNLLNNLNLSKSASFNLVTVVVFSLLVSFIIQNSYASEVSAVSLTLTVPSSPLSVNLNPSTDNGFAKSTDGNISVSTAANWGFQLSVQAKDSNALKNGSNSLTSITTSIDEATFKSNADYVNKWGFRPSKVNGSTNSNFIAGPTTSPTIIEKTSASSASVSQYTIAIGAKANSTLATGTYSNNFTFTATANTVSYNITYNLDSGTWSGKSPQTGSTIEKTIKLDENKPTKDGFEFLGWCNVEPTGNNTDNPTCDSSNNGTIYTAGQDYPLTNGSNTVTLNAIWKSTMPAAVDKGSLGTMQNFNCDSSLPNIHEYGTVTDSRDNNTYKVAKLMDGKCWMIDNLKIVGLSISSSNSDITSGSFSIPASNLSTFKTSSSTVNNSAAYVDSYGGSYTWYTATAGTGSSSITSDGVNATGSICPKGWRLPTSGSSSSGDFADLVTAYGGNNSTGSAALRATPVPGFTYAGYVYYYNGSLAAQGSNGSYWSSTSGDSTGAYRLSLYSSSALPASNGYRVGGQSVRCVAREPKKITDLQYLQDWNDLTDDEKTQVKNSMQDEKNYTLTDKRDNTEYTVAKLKDGKIWMTQNLKIAGKNISSSDSDVSSSFEIPAATAASTFQTSSSNVNNSKAYVDSYGGLYTWYTATAGTGNSSITSGGVNATGSICPKGWRLPTSGSSSSVDFADLVTAYGGNNSTGSAALRTTPVPGFTYAGFVNYNNGSLRNQGSFGYYWSSTSYSSTNAYYLYLYSSFASPASFNDYRVSGRSVRCVAR